MLPFDLPPLPPPVPVYAPSTCQAPAPPWYLAKEAVTPVAPEERAFHQAVSNFQQHLARLSPKHKAEMRKIHKDVTMWADKERASGQKADKLATFVGKVMNYCDSHLRSLEQADPDLVRLKAEHQQFQDLFMAGNRVINSYLAWVRTDSKPQPKPKPKPATAPKP